MSAPTPITALADFFAARYRVPDAACVPHPFSALEIDGRFGHVVLRASYSARMLDSAGQPSSQVCGLESPLEALADLYRNLPIYRVYTMEKKLEVLRQRTAAAYADLCAARKQVDR